MSIKADFHLHTSFSGDSDTPMEEMILRAIELGFTHLCITEHNDFDYPSSADMPEGKFLLSTESYLLDYLKYKEKYASKINLLFGVELGLQPHLLKQNIAYVQQYDFDFVIGSSHVCNRKDPYYPSFYEGRSEEDAYREYFSSIIENVKLFSDFDVYGHLDYVVRYGPNCDHDYSYEKYKDLFEQILELLLEKEIGIEINTGGIQKGLKELHPCTAVIKRYRELGGNIVTIGSDAHEVAHLGNYFTMVKEVLEECGFKYYTVFEKRMPEFHLL